MKEIYLTENVKTENVIVITIENEELFKEEMGSYLANQGYVDFKDLEELNFESCSVINYENSQDNHQELIEELSDLLFQEFGIE
jgi:hypothetical protein